MIAQAGPARNGYAGPASLRQRTLSALSSALVLALLGYIVVRMGDIDWRPPGSDQRLTAITIRAASASAAKKAAAPEKPHSAAVPQVQVQVIPPMVAIPVPKAPTQAFIRMSNADLAAADISRLGGGGAGQGASSQDYGPGEGPQGQRLFRAEWVREPSRAELAGYMTEHSVRADWAEIACRTIEHYHVDNCQSLGESPPGSGLARSLRQAAWQFLVRPPSIDGKPQVGAWVRIHFDFTHGTAK